MLKKAGKGSDVEQLNNAQLASLMKSTGFEMKAEEIANYLDLLKEAGVDRAFLVGSEPTEHSDFETILDSALNRGMKLLIYTSGASLDKLKHPAVSTIVLHLDENKFGKGKMSLDARMAQVNELLDLGKEIHLRVNFSSPEMTEKVLVFNFYEKLKPRHKSNVLLKYSFTTKVSGSPEISYFTPESLKAVAPKIIGFVDEFKGKLPATPVYSERPLFRCAFSDEEWKRYTKKGGFTAKCEMEFVVYQNAGLAFCPPARGLATGKKIETAQELVERVMDLKKKFDEVSSKPSFKVCVNCKRRINLTCQGGCGGYKC